MHTLTNNWRVLPLLFLVSCAHLSPEPSSVLERSFHIHYQATIEGLPQGKMVQVWIPVPHRDSHQVIRDLEITGDFPGEITLQTESVHGNQMAYFEGTISTPSLTFDVEYEVDRFNYETDFDSIEEVKTSSSEDLARYLKPSTLCFVNETTRLEAKEIASGKSSSLEIARGFYDHILARMAYDKNHEGWGRGSIEHACEIGMGNCTDFHTYFNSLCLAAGIPSRFQIGIWGKYDIDPGTVYTTGGYHCWAEFHLPGHGWVPVDISEADKDPTLTEACFGSHSANRVTVSTGRDIILEPAQAGSPLNFFIYPYAEVDGKTHPIEKTSTWKDLNGS